jgi:hypothetical protein
MTDREFWLRMREGCLMQLGAIEGYLGMQRSVPPKRKQETLTEAMASNPAYRVEVAYPVKR